MFQVGNKFGTKKKEPDMIQIDPDAPATLLAAHQTLGSAKKAYQVRVEKLAALTAQLAELDRRIGQKLADDEVADTEILEQQALQGRVRQLESAMTVLMQRRDDAEAAVQRAEQAIRIDRQCTALEHLQVVALEVDAAIATLGHVTSKLAAALEQARLTGAGGKYQSFLVDAKLELQRFVNMAIDEVTGTGKVPDRMRRYAKWSECIPGPETARVTSRHE
jgi:HEPN domain-containing protein